MRTTDRAAAASLRRRLPLVAVVAAAGALLVGCASDQDATGGDPFGGGEQGATSWPASVPRPALPLVEETDLLIAYTATYELGGGTADEYVAELEAAGFRSQGESSYADGEHVVLVEVELDRLFVTITEA